jgi:predicted nuclease of restriction endonuclease-like (RecB) superfamily
MSGETLTEAYQELLDDLKDCIRNARVHAALSVNRELVLLYWQIGQSILERQAKDGWGAKVIERLADDLRREFSDMKGLSRANLFYMRAFAEAYPSEQIVQQLAGQIPWWHNVVIMTRIKDPELREWYIRACIENGWSRAVLMVQIDTRLHERTGMAITNFHCTLPAPQSELAQQILKDPYNFEFLTTYDSMIERDLHKGLLEHLKDFMLELGVGFAFVGSNYHLEIGEEDFYLDLLFYHLRLRSFVVVELKTVEFKPEYAGKLSFYLSATDDLLRHPQDNPTIGILLCRGKNRVVVEYALRNVHQPIGVAEYQLAKALPDSLKGSLPTVEQLEAELKAVETQDQQDERNQNA